MVALAEDATVKGGSIGHANTAKRTRLVRIALEQKLPLVVDQFLLEQLAGDELVARPYRNLSDTDKDRLIATGFLRNGPDGTGDRAVNQDVARNEVLADTINIVSTSLRLLSN